jgi:hypothetical protein
MSVKTPANRIVAREGVNATQALFESMGCVFQEVAQQNDFGKDAYVEIVEDGMVTHLCVAIQIKSGESFRLASGDYFIPVANHAFNWRLSTVPVFGVVYDPTDCLLRWADLTNHLRSHPGQEGGNIHVHRDHILDKSTILGPFRDAVQRYTSLSGGAVALNLLSNLQALQTDAVFDAWALGRQDARYLILLRRLILDLHPIAVRKAIALLSHATPHPDIFWTKKNWIPQEIEEQVQPTFQWTPQELSHMFRAVGEYEWGRGTLGQCLDMLIYEDPSAITNLHATVGSLLKNDHLSAAVRVAIVAVAHSRDASEEVAALIKDYPTLATDEWFEAIIASVKEQGSIDLY